MIFYYRPFILLLRFPSEKFSLLSVGIVLQNILNFVTYKIHAVTFYVFTVHIIKTDIPSGLFSKLANHSALTFPPEIRLRIKRDQRRIFLEPTGDISRITKRIVFSIQ